MTTLRDLDWVPAPHDTEHVEYGPKALSLQFKGHSCALQARVSALWGHAAPPNRGATVDRLRDCAPLPHDLVQVV